MKEIFLYSFYPIFDPILYALGSIICSHHDGIHEFSFHTWSTVRIFFIEEDTVHKNTLDKISNNSNNKKSGKDKTDRIARETAGKAHK